MLLKVIQWNPRDCGLRKFYPVPMSRKKSLINVAYLIKKIGLFGQLDISQERRQKLEQINQQLVVQNPTL